MNSNKITSLDIKYLKLHKSTTPVYSWKPLIFSGILPYLRNLKILMSKVFVFLMGWHCRKRKAILKYGSCKYMSAGGIYNILQEHPCCLDQLHLQMPWKGTCQFIVIVDDNNSSQPSLNPKLVRVGYINPLPIFHSI